MNKHLLRTVVRNQYVVSTVLLNYIGFGNGFFRPEYETMVFHCDETGKVTDWLELDCLRDSTESEAMISHADLIFKWGAPE